MRSGRHNWRPATLHSFSHFRLFCASNRPEEVDSPSLCGVMPTIMEALLLARQSAPNGPGLTGLPPGGTGITGPPQRPPASTYHNVPFLNERAPLLGLTITFMIISWICSLSRLYVRFFIKRVPGWDDFFIILTLLSTTLGSIVLCIMTEMGLGHNKFDMPLTSLVPILKTIYITTLTYPLSSTFIKIALLLQYLTTFGESGTHAHIRTVCYVTGFFTALSGLAFSGSSIFPCWPVSDFWEYTTRDPKCWGFGSRDQGEFMAIQIAQVVSSSILDLLVFVIPGWMYVRGELTMSRAGRWSLVGLFGLGLAAIICSLWRVVYVIQLKDSITSDDITKKRDFDPLFDSPTIMGLASFESHLAAICAALPILWPVIKTTWDRIFVTYEVTVTQEYGGVFPKKTAADIELQSVPASLNEQHDSSGWVPFVGDETTGLGENTTSVVTEKDRRASRVLGGLFRKKRGGVTSII